MNVEKITVYAAYGGGDDRGCQQTIISYHSSESDAEAAAQGQGFYGGNGSVRSQPALKVGDEVYLLEQEEPIDLDGKQAQVHEATRKSALAKLTPAEIEVLGLNLNKE